MFPLVSCELLVYGDLCKLVRCVCGWYNQNSVQMNYRWELRWLKVHVMEGGWGGEQEDSPCPLTRQR